MKRETKKKSLVKRTTVPLSRLVKGTVRKTKIVKDNDAAFEDALKSALIKIPAEATREAFKKGLPVTGISNGNVVKIYPNKEEETISKVEEVKPLFAVTRKFRLK